MKTEEEILKLKSSYHSYIYCLDNEDTANIEAHQNIIINNRECYYILKFAQDIEKANKELLFKELLKTDEFDWIYAFYNSVSFCKDEFKNLPFFNEEECLKLKDFEYSFYFCKYNKDANVEAHQQIIIDLKDLDFYYIFAKNIKGSNKQLLSEIVLASGNLPWIKEYYKHIDFDKTKYEALMLFI
jgi:hypothetical protein